MEHNNDADNDVVMKFFTSSEDMTGATEKMRLSHDGYLGIGTTTPAHILQIKI